MRSCKRDNKKYSKFLLFVALALTAVCIYTGDFIVLVPGGLFFLTSLFLYFRRTYYVRVGDDSITIAFLNTPQDSRITLSKDLVKIRYGGMRNGASQGEIQDLMDLWVEVSERSKLRVDRLPKSRQISRVEQYDSGYVKAFTFEMDDAVLDN